jgi:hypothetical protein
MNKYLPLFILTVLLALSSPAICSPTPNANEKNDRIEFVIGPMKISPGSTGSAIIFLFGAFCALWAQNTNRNAWLWFFLGLFFTILTVFVLLYKNSKDKNPPKTPFDLKEHQLQ